MDILLIALVVLGPAFSHQQCVSNEATPSDNTQEEKPFHIGQQLFSIDLLREVNNIEPDKNVFFSPHSIYNALLIAYLGTANQTEHALKRALHIPQNQTKTATMEAYSLEKFFQGMRYANGSESYELRSVNHLFFSDDIQLKECMEKLFKDELIKINFASNPEEARQKINNWIQEQTKNQIKDLIPKEEVDAETKVVLANAAYFKGLWQSKFLPENTQKDVFFINSYNKTLVTMMRQKGTFNHLVSERLGAHVLELPYKGKDVSMFILLPPFVNDGVNIILSQLSEETLREIIEEGSMFPRSAEVSIPKFAIEYTMELLPVLNRIGVGDLFESSSDFSGFTDEPNNIHLGGAVHKAKIDVDEDGTVAAAATALFSFRSSRPLNPTKFNCNHPFVYFLYDRMSQSILFTGIFRTPPKRIAEE